MPKLASRHRFLILAVLCLLSAVIAGGAMGWIGYVQSWVGSAFRTLSGAYFGWAVSYYVLKLDLSKIDASQRSVAALSQAILIAGCANAVAVGV